MRTLGDAARSESEGNAFILTFATAADRIEAMRPSFAEIAKTARIEPRS